MGPLYDVMLLVSVLPSVVVQSTGMVSVPHMYDVLSLPLSSVLMGLIVAALNRSLVD